MGEETKALPTRLKDELKIGEGKCDRVNSEFVHVSIG